MTAPGSVTLRGDRIPQELRALRQWVCWRLEERGSGKPTKVPLTVHGRKASSTDPATWNTFTACLHAAKQYRFDGVGFIFTANDPYAGLDLDDCIDPATGDMAPWAKDKVARLDSYTELSQSRTGVHTVGKATLPPGGRKKGNIEMYDCGRFFVMTGEHLAGTPITIEDRQAEFAALHAEVFATKAEPARPQVNGAVLPESDHALLEKMFAAANGGKVSQLWAGDTSGYASPSEADLALCSHLAFWTGGNPAWMEALFRQSGLYREAKWERADYRERTITKALQQATCYDPRHTNGTRSFVHSRPAPEDWPLPETLPAALPPVPVCDPALLPDRLRPYVSDIAERMQCPLDFPSVALVICLASVLGRQLGIRPKRQDDWLVVPNLWGAVVGRPGVMKTPAILEPVKQIQQLEAQARGVHEEAMYKYEAHKALAEARRKLAKKDLEKLLKEGQELTAEDVAQRLSDEEAPPTRRRFLTNDCTVEKLGELLAENPRGMLVFRDELTGLLQSLDKEGREETRAFFLEAWNGTGRFVYDRIGRGTIDLESACVSILGGIQPGPLSAYLSATLKQGVGDDGLLQRFQLLVWPDITPQWRNVDRWPATEARQDVHQLFLKLDSLALKEIGAQHEEDDEIPFLRFDAEAQEEFDTWRAQLERRLRGEEESPAFEAHLAKYRSLIPSLALLFHVADGGSGAVGTQPLMRAMAWSEYLEAHARRVYAIAMTPGLAAARELHRHIISGKLSEEFTARDVYLKGWRLLDTDGTKDALQYLESLHHIRSERRETGGRPQVVWQVNPQLKISKNV